MARNPIKRIDPPKTTARAQFSTFNEMFTPGWDKQPAALQKMDRVAERSAMGQKMTPLGPGTLKPAR
jgi:hypothetical protein